MQSIEVSRADRHCHRCENILLLAVRVPHTIENAAGTTVRGTRTVGLCPQCDRDNPAAQGVLAFFTVNDVIDDENIASAGAVVRQWIDDVQVHTISLTAIDELRD